MSVVPMRQTVLGMKMKGPDQQPGKNMRWHAIGGLCLLKGYRKGAELGVSTGRFTMYLCAIMSDLTMTCVDLWAEQKPKEGTDCAETYSGWDHEGSYQRFKENCANYFPGRVEIHRMDSAAAADLVEDGSLDFVFIDADHTLEGCRRDIAAWYPKVRKGGMVAGHDFNWRGVHMALAEWDKPIANLYDNVWVHFKNE